MTDEEPVNFNEEEEGDDEPIINTVRDYINSDVVDESLCFRSTVALNSAQSRLYTIIRKPEKGSERGDFFIHPDGYEDIGGKKVRCGPITVYLHNHLDDLVST